MGELSMLLTNEDTFQLTGIRNQLDRHGTRHTHRVLNEKHELTLENRGEFAFILPRYAPFFTENLTIKRTDVIPHVQLVYGQDYFFNARHLWSRDSKTETTNLETAYMIIFDDVHIEGRYTINYQSLGGDFVLDYRTYTEIVGRYLNNPLEVTFDEIVGKKVEYLPDEHKHSVEDLIGVQGLVTTINDLTDVYRELIRIENSRAGLFEEWTELMERSERNATEALRLVREELEQFRGGRQEVDLSNYYTKAEVDDKPLLEYARGGAVPLTITANANRSEGLFFDYDLPLRARERIVLFPNNPDDFEKTLIQFGDFQRYTLSPFHNHELINENRTNDTRRNRVGNTAVIQKVLKQNGSNTLLHIGNDLYYGERRPSTFSTYRIPGKNTNYEMVDFKQVLMMPIRPYVGTIPSLSNWRGRPEMFSYHSLYGTPNFINPNSTRTTENIPPGITYNGIGFGLKFANQIRSSTIYLSGPGENYIEHTRLGLEGKEREKLLTTANILTLYPQLGTADNKTYLEITNKTDLSVHNAILNRTETMTGYAHSLIRELDFSHQQTQFNVSKIDGFNPQLRISTKQSFLFVPKTDNEPGLYTYDNNGRAIIHFDNDSFSLPHYYSNQKNLYLQHGASTPNIKLPPSIVVDGYFGVRDLLIVNKRDETSSITSSEDFVSVGSLLSKIMRVSLRQDEKLKGFDASIAQIPTIQQKADTAKSLADGINIRLENGHFKRINDGRYIGYNLGAMSLSELKNSEVIEDEKYTYRWIGNHRTLISDVFLGYNSGYDSNLDNSVGENEYNEIVTDLVNDTPASLSIVPYRVSDVQDIYDSFDSGTAIAPGLNDSVSRVYFRRTEHFDTGFRSNDNRYPHVNTKLFSDNTFFCPVLNMVGRDDTDRSYLGTSPNNFEQQNAYAKLNIWRTFNKFYDNRDQEQQGNIRYVAAPGVCVKGAITADELYLVSPDSAPSVKPDGTSTIPVTVFSLTAWILNTEKHIARIESERQHLKTKYNRLVSLLKQKGIIDSQEDLDLL